MGVVDKLRRAMNEAYNRHYVTSRAIPDSRMVWQKDMENGSENIKFSAPFMTVWLKNIDRIIRLAGIDCRDHHFLDVGCGKGISTIYASEKYDFKSFGGFDFEQKFVDTARRNLEGCAVRNKRGIEFFKGDASGIVLEEKRWFIYMFNPFSENVMAPFIGNNAAMFRRTGSVIGYANSCELDCIRRFSPVSVQEIPAYRCAVVKF
jgi:SAM-dependent methyltransferase